MNLYFIMIALLLMTFMISGCVDIPEDLKAVDGQGAGEAFNHGDARGFRPGNPPAQKRFGSLFVRLLPNLPQVLFEVVGDRQRLVQLQRFLQTAVYVT